MDQLWGDKCVNRDHSELNKFQMRGEINCTASNLGRVILLSLSLSLYIYIYVYLFLSLYIYMYIRTWMYMHTFLKKHCGRYTILKVRSHLSE